MMLVVVGINVLSIVLGVLTSYIIWCVIPNDRTECKDTTKYGPIIKITDDEQYSGQDIVGVDYLYHVSYSRLRQGVLDNIMYTLSGVVAACYCSALFTSLVASMIRGIMSGGLIVSLGYLLALWLPCSIIGVARFLAGLRVNYIVKNTIGVYHEEIRVVSNVYLIVNAALTIYDALCVYTLLSML